MNGDPLQLLVNGAMAGAVLAVPAIGFTAVYAVLRFPNFGLAGLATIGAYAGLVANAWWGWPAYVALLAAFLAAGFVGVLVDEGVLRRLRPAAGGPGGASGGGLGGLLAAAIGSVALNIVLENCVRFAWGNELRGYDLPVLRDWRLGPVRVGPQQAENAALAACAMTALFLCLRYTRVGKMLRAVADNPGLAALKGMDARAAARLATFVGMGLAGFGGMLLGLDTTVDPQLGFRAMLSVFAAAVVGGLGSIPGAVLGAFLVGIGEEISLLVLDPAYRTAVGFAAILLVLLFRPRGLLGERAY